MSTPSNGTYNPEDRLTHPLRHIDMSSEERLIKYSRDIQHGTRAFLQFHANRGELYPDLKTLSIEVANTMKTKKGDHPHYITVMRHIEQLTGTGEQWDLLDQAAGIVIIERPRQPV